MNTNHARITCNVCGWNHNVGMGYACLICNEYDLCERCYFSRRYNRQHRPFHPMQAILSEEEFFDSLRRVNSKELRVFCCPYCGEKRLSADNMVAHCQRFHHTDEHPVRCPICLVYKMSNRFLLGTTLLQHMQCLHQQSKAPNRDPQPAPQRTQLCPICMEPMAEMGCVGTMKCGHQFHSSCITHWLMDNSTCPVCRANIATRD